jgi:iron complex outermembrane receptor protein
MVGQLVSFRPFVLGRLLHAAVLIAICPAAAPAAAASQDPDPVPSTAATAAQTPAGLERLSIEELARISVLSTSRHTEPVTDAVASITVITGESLRRAGVRTLPEALRLATGVAVGRAGHAWSISARGFNSAAANKMVVLLDGRSLYSPLFSGVFWNIADVLLADVDRIEVVRGAGGTLWGANAMNGVINIITKLASETPGALVQIGAGTAEHIVAARYGGRMGDGAYRVHAKFRHLGAMPLLDGSGSTEPMRAGQAGVRLDFGPAAAEALTLHGEAYRGSVDAGAGASVDFDGASVLLRARRTFPSGAQLQVQAYYDTTYRRVPTQYAERRHTGDAELQYRFSAGTRHDIVAGVGLTVSHDRTEPTPTFFFDPAARTFTLVNVFAQDEITLAPGRLWAIVGSKFEHNTYTGFEAQPTVRVRWRPAAPHTIWGGVSRAVRMPTRFDTDLRFTANTPVVVLRGSHDFRSETMVGGELGYRVFLVPRVALSAAVFANRYDDLRSQEPTPPSGIPVALANKHEARTSGFELTARVDIAAPLSVSGGYALLRERFSFEPDSGDGTGGSLEHNDPAHQLWLRAAADPGAGLELDATFRWVSALPQPRVPSYGELMLRVARRLSDRFTVELVGDNLLHDRHPEWFNLGPRFAVPRSLFARLTWQSR